MQLTEPIMQPRQANEALPTTKMTIVQDGSSPMVTGLSKRFIKWMMWKAIIAVAVRKFKNLRVAFRRVKQLKQLRDQYRDHHLPIKYASVNNKYFVNYNSPGWPSVAFNNYISHLLNRVSTHPSTTINTLVFAITKKCGFQCEHCCEWDNLNKPEVLLREDLLEIILRFQKLGVSQVQLSGGEPLNRFNDILFVLDNAAKGTDFWLYTTGYQLTAEKVFLLKQHGLTGITISIDHYIPEHHDRFRGKRGSFERALKAADYAKEAGLAVCLSLCATKQFINMGNLMNYAEMAKKAGASFIQILEPKAVGHYANQPVTLAAEHKKILEMFVEKINYKHEYARYPIVTYHGHYSRRLGCSGSGKDYVYVDTDGDIHNCPFCQRKLFSAFHDDLAGCISEMKIKGCGVYSLTAK